MKLAAFTAKNVRTARNFPGTKKCSNGMVFGHLTKTFYTAMSMTQTGAKLIQHLDFHQLEILNLEYKYIFFFKGNKNKLDIFK